MKYTIKRNKRCQKGLEKGMITKEEIRILKEHYEKEKETKRRTS